jgi:hypothetical protein
MVDVYKGYPGGGIAFGELVPLSGTRFRERPVRGLFASPAEDFGGERGIIRFAHDPPKGRLQS